MSAFRTIIALTAGLLATVPAAAQGTPPTCEDGWTLHDGANGMPYCLRDGIPSISQRKPWDALSFTNCDEDGAICTTGFEEVIQDARLYFGAEFTFTHRVSWEALDQSVGSEFRIAGAHSVALFTDDGTARRCKLVGSLSGKSRD